LTARVIRIYKKWMTSLTRCCWNVK